MSNKLQVQMILQSNYYHNFTSHNSLVRVLSIQSPERKDLKNLGIITIPVNTTIWTTYTLDIFLCIFNDQWNKEKGKHV